MDPIGNLFDLLDRWRHLPKYQLERRADIFFAVYLRQFLQDECLRVPLRPQLIPEFPIHLPSIGRAAPGELSCNVDYVAVADDLGAIFFVEFKTDLSSRRADQDRYMEDARAAGMAKLLDGLKRITAATPQKRKYLHLLLLLEQAGLLSLPAALREMPSRKSLRGFDAELAHVAVTRTGPIQVYYLQPRQISDDAPHPNTITFDRLSKWLEQFDDPLTRRFRQSLQRWSATAAGDGS